LVCDRLNSTLCAARFFFFLMLTTSARSAAVLGREAFCFGLAFAWVGVAVVSGVSSAAVTISLLALTSED
jgi:hypothetical protein